METNERNERNERIADYERRVFETVRTNVGHNGAYAIHAYVVDCVIVDAKEYDDDIRIAIANVLRRETPNDDAVSHDEINVFVSAIDVTSS